MIINSIIIESNWQSIESIRNIINSFCWAEITIKGSSGLIENIDQLSIHVSQVIGLDSWANIILIDDSSGISAVIFWVVKTPHFPEAVFIIIQKQFSCSKISQLVLSCGSTVCWLGLLVVSIHTWDSTYLAKTLWIRSNNKIMQHRTNGFISKKDIVILYLNIASLKPKDLCDFGCISFAATVYSTCSSALRYWGWGRVLVVQAKDLTNKSYAFFIDRLWIGIWSVSQCSTS